MASLRDEVLRLARMVDDLQTLAAADAATLQLSLRRCDLAEVAAAAADSLAGRFEAAGSPLSGSSPRPGPRRPALAASGDHEPAHQRAEVHPGRRPGDHQAGPTGADAVLQVTDTGAGIPADELPHIFERFWRGQQAAQTSGSGIGLAVAAELARAHGGQLAASSEPGRGTQMTLTLPGA